MLPKRNPVLFLDENMRSEAIVVPVRAFTDWDVELYGDHFADGKTDAELVEFCGPRGWTLVSCDDGFRYTEECKKVIQRCKSQVFTIILKKETHAAQIGAALINAHDRILRTVKQERGLGLCAHIYLNGGVKVMTRFPAEAVTGRTTQQERTLRKYGRI
jgi:hypothetical protein